MQATANEKQSASGGWMITKLHFRYIDANKQLISKISRRVAVFSFLPSQQKGKRNRNSASFAPLTTLSNVEGESRWSGISAMLRCAVRKLKINACSIMCCQENGNNIILPIVSFEIRRI
jgi:hypothetical protein